jgi:hypothetical protein
MSKLMIDAAQNFLFPKWFIPCRNYITSKRQFSVISNVTGAPEPSLPIHKCLKPDDLTVVNALPVPGYPPCGEFWTYLFLFVMFHEEDDLRITFTMYFTTITKAAYY